jgi:mannosyltransferase OCH1-like enzyme
MALSSSHRILRLAQRLFTGDCHKLKEMRLVQFWHSQVVPDDVRVRVESFRSKNPEFEHILFSEQTAAAFIKQHYSKRESAAFQACAVPAMKADYFRYCALLKFGGIYADADMVCLKALSPLVEETAHAMFFYRPSQVVPNGFLMVRSAGLSLLSLALQIATLNIERRYLDNVWLATGPGIISTIYNIYRQGSVEAFLASLTDRNSKFNIQLAMLADTLRNCADFNIQLGVLADTIRNCADFNIPKLLDGVQFAPIEQRDAYVNTQNLAYKQSAIHWMNWNGSIYRDCSKT